MGSISLFCFIAAVIVVVTRLILETMEEKDRASGVAVNHEEYTIMGLLRLMFRERKENIKARRSAKKAAKEKKGK